MELETARTLTEELIADLAPACVPALQLLPLIQVVMSDETISYVSAIRRVEVDCYRVRLASGDEFTRTAQQLDKLMTREWRKLVDWSGLRLDKL